MRISQFLYKLGDFQDAIETFLVTNTVYVFKCSYTAAEQQQNGFSSGSMSFGI